MSRLAHARPFVLAALAGAALALAGSLPAQAQVRVAPSVGYDADAAAPSLGLGVDVPLGPARRGVALAIRPSVEVVFSTSDAVGYLECGTGLDDDPRFLLPRTTDTRFVRVGADVVARRASASVGPYAKVGLALERRLSDGIFGPNWDSNLGATLGLGVEAHRLFAEATVGSSAVSAARLAVGVRF